MGRVELNQSSCPPDTIFSQNDGAEDRNNEGLLFTAIPKLNTDIFRCFYKLLHPLQITYTLVILTCTRKRHLHSCPCLPTSVARMFPLMLRVASGPQDHHRQKKKKKIVSSLYMFLMLLRLKIMFSKKN
jgi:hypothetical protein